MKFINTTFGLGDVFILFVVAFGFPTYAFLILLSLAILFALACHFLLKANYVFKTIPLAGYLSLFFACILIADFFPSFPDLYMY
ncbi:hypothetical protein HX109_10885 [Galbibacter sp. BG1]|uniref:hypothetical protein n=1 Tax=Galbibacter sp. BG1 TaxID=1170699 RepID=UPI0015BE74D5|nr:hypothetical protein [Galbibacter sp. BG1]QLE02034.1 hypothetical protein HX109_10885 [Galbibacter sp. BG1]